MIRKGYVDTSGGQCHYRYTEGQGDPIVFLHQTPSSSLMFEKLMHSLEGMNAVAIDTPGFGQSFNPTDEPMIKDYSTWLIEAIHSLEINDYHLFGHHTGASIAMQISLMEEQSVKSLTLVGPFLATAEEKMEMKKNISSNWSPTKDGSHLEKAWHLAGDILGAKNDLALRQRETLDALRAHHSAEQMHHAVWEYSDIDTYKKIQQPCLIMCAKDDVMYPFFNRAKEINPNSQTQVILGKNLELDLDTESIANKFKGFINKI